MEFSGATAALKGGNGLGSFAMSKFAIRAMAQSLAREFGPKGIHVAHAVVDGIIDTEKTMGFHQEVPSSKISPGQVSRSQSVLLSSLVSTYQLVLYGYVNGKCLYRLPTRTGTCIHSPKPHLHMSWISDLTVKTGKDKDKWFCQQ